MTVSVTSPNLQGTRTAVTAENGDFVITVLPSGTYSVTFELSGFQRATQSVSLAPTQDLPIKVELGPADVTEEVTVVGQPAEVLTQTAQVATNFKQELIASLPTNRDINAYLLLAPAVHPSGPNGAYSIAGSASFDNLFLVNAKVSDDMVYKILDTLEKNKADLVAVQPVLRAFSAANGYKKYDMPYHPGALKYYKEHHIEAKSLE